MKINDRWEIASDSFNFILREHYINEKGNHDTRESFHNTLEQSLQTRITREGKGHESLSEAIDKITAVRNDIRKHVKTCSRN